MPRVTKQTMMEALTTAGIHFPEKASFSQMLSLYKSIGCNDGGQNDEPEENATVDTETVLMLKNLKETSLSRICFQMKSYRCCCCCCYIKFNR